MKKVIVTGDDFGLAVPVNEAVVEAHRRGILTAASLMVAGNAARDAVERAHATASLRVGLHLVLVEGKPVLPPASVPNLVNSRGEFPTRLFRAGLNFFFRPESRAQLEAEIRAQFEAFLETGLPLDHVDAHNHMHVHPTVLGLLLKIGREFGYPPVRLPYEPPLRSWRASGKALPGKIALWVLLGPWIGLMRSRLRNAGVRFNNAVFGMNDSGAMTEALVLRMLRQLPDGATEIYFHPATRRCPEIDRTMPDYRHVEEFEALTSRRVAEALEAAGVRRIAFGDL